MFFNANRSWALEKVNLLPVTANTVTRRRVIKKLIPAAEMHISVLFGPSLN